MGEYKGQCACGAVAYSIDGEPINTAFCYCKSCQVHTGSDKWFGVWVPKEKLTFTKGQPTLYTRLGDSGKDMIHNICGHCGTTLCIEVTVGNFYSVSASTLDNHENLKPNIAIYTASAPSWAVFPEGIAKYDVLPPELSG
ncbi:GFA family protein [Zooshikella ganghwensis]|uniref:GFA family protein n=1 Tax=Zooshikella ganghwensis TaxID=202772 RepID=UPI00042783A6|nr:GFA family protein [Zooshikella ganghwensis]